MYGGSDKAAKEARDAANEVAVDLGFLAGYHASEQTRQRIERAATKGDAEALADVRRNQHTSCQVVCAEAGRKGNNDVFAAVLQLLMAVQELAVFYASGGYNAHAGEGYQQSKPCSRAMKQLFVDMVSDRIGILDKPEYVEAHVLRNLLADRLNLNQRHDAVAVLRHILDALAAEVTPLKYARGLTNLGRLRYRRHGIVNEQFSTLLDTAWACEAEEWKPSHAYHTSQPALCIDLVFRPGWGFEEALAAYFAAQEDFYRCADCCPHVGMRCPGHSAHELVACAPFLFMSVFRFEGGKRKRCEAVNRYPVALDLAGALRPGKAARKANPATTYRLVGMVCHGASTLAENKYETVVRKGGTGAMSSSSVLDNAQAIEPARWLHFTGTGACEIDEATACEDFLPQLLLWRREPTPAVSAADLARARKQERAAAKAAQAPAPGRGKARKGGKKPKSDKKKRS